MLQKLALSALSSALLLSALMPALAQQQTLSVDKSSVLVYANTRGIYYPKPGQGDDTRSSWMPYLSFNLNGPIEAGTSLEVQYSIKNKPWISFDLSPSPGNWYRFSREGSMLKDEQATLETGPISLTIKAINELSGLNSLLYKATLNVKKYNLRDPQKFPNFKNKFGFYVDEDWRLPYAFLSGNWYNSNDINGVEHMPNLNLKLWFRGDNLNRMEGHLYHNGKHIAKATASQTEGVKAYESDEFVWSQASFTYSGSMDSAPVIFYDSSENPEAHTHAFNLYSNPGEYELKVLQDGQLSRSVKFTVGPNGAVVDNGFGKALNHPSSWILPVKVLKQTDGKTDLNAWKTGAFYANLIPGFALP